MSRREHSPAGSASLEVYLEEGRRRTFAVAVRWPGWARSGRTSDDALETLATYVDRYAAVLRAAGLELPARPAGAGPAPGHARDGETRGAATPAEAGLDVVARVPGNAATDFGAPGVVPDLERTTWDPDEADRQARILSAAWARFDEIAAGAPTELRKGPRGGGRDRDAIVAHVLDAEHAYRRKAGLKRPAPADRAGTDALREEFLALVRSAPAPEAGSPTGAVTGSDWPLPYAVRRIAWHVLDHAWEIEDRS